MVQLVKMQSITVISPATSANLGPGFDTFAIAIEGLHDRVIVRSMEEKGIQVKNSGLGAGIPTDPLKNTGGVVAQNMIIEFGLGGISLEIDKGVPPGKGLGSSAATASAVAFGINRMFRLELSNEELLKFASSGEVASSGVAHPDNVAGALFGGFVIVHSKSLHISSFPPPRGLSVCIGIPIMETPPKKTGRARGVLPSNVPLDDVTHNISSAAIMVAGFARGDMELIGIAMHDNIVEPARASLVPGYSEVRSRTITAGALGIAISGAGPSMIAFLDNSKVKITSVGNAMKSGFKSAGLRSSIIHTKIGSGVRVIKK